MSATPLTQLVNSNGETGTTVRCPWCYRPISDGDPITLVLRPVKTYLCTPDGLYDGTEVSYTQEDGNDGTFVAKGILHADFDWDQQTAYHDHCYDELLQRVITATATATNRNQDKWEVAKRALDESVLPWIIEQLSIDGDKQQVLEILAEVVEEAWQQR
jgi:hypothetical protein